MVGAEYIFEEKARGEPLARHWYRWGKEWQLNIIRQIVAVEAKLGSLAFSKHGNIYYQSDLESKNISCAPLPQDIARATTDVNFDLPALTNFSIGPVTQAILWHSERAAMNLDKGQCKTNHRTLHAEC